MLVKWKCYKDGWAARDKYGMVKEKKVFVGSAKLSTQPWLLMSLFAASQMQALGRNCILISVGGGE